MTLKSWQKVLAQRGHYTGDLDGISGPLTVDATKRYQAELRHLGLYRGELDGLVGPQTLAAHKLNVAKAGPVETGTQRTDWRGYVDVTDSQLAAVLPKQAQHLAKSFRGIAEVYGLNPFFLMAISKHETANWTSNAFLNRGNAMGISNSVSVANQPSHGESIRKAAFSLTRPKGYYAKCVSLADVGGVYAPVGAMNDPGKLNSYWPGAVAKYWAQMEGAK